MKKQLVAVAALLAASVVAFPSAAMAGEVTGSGGQTGMRGHAHSLCGFSGLEDMAASPLRTQTPHEVWINAAVGVVNPPPGSPGTQCNPKKSTGE